MVGVKGQMPCVSGLLVAKELEAFSNVLDPSKVQRPLTAIVGGAKIRDKILVIENLIDQSDRIMCIGGMAYTFLKVSAGMAIGKSLFDKKGAEMVPRLLEKAKAPRRLCNSAPAAASHREPRRGCPKPSRPRPLRPHLRPATSR